MKLKSKKLHMRGAAGKIPRGHGWNVEPPATVKLAPDFDHMPKQVATELLASSFRISNRMRKECNKARERHFISTLERKSQTDKVAGKLKTATLAQLDKWLTRSIDRRADTQRAFLLAKRRAEKSTDKRDIVLFERMIAALDLKAGQLDFIRDCIETELNRRHESMAARGK